jgi:DNA polymerase III alpha subunit
VTRVNLRTVNKKTLESLAYAGAFDCYPEIHRAIYFEESEGSTFIEKIIRYANKSSELASSAQASLFGMLGDGGGADIAKNSKYRKMVANGAIKVRKGRCGHLYLWSPARYLST